MRGENRRAHLKRIASALAAPALASAQIEGRIDYTIKLDTIRRGYVQDFAETDTSGFHKYCWVHARAGAIPGDPAKVVLLMQKLMLSGSDVFYAMTEMRTDDLGRTWSDPREHSTLGRRKESSGLESVLTAAFPSWHKSSGKLLAAGSIIRYAENKYAGGKAPREIGYSVYNPDSRTWLPWATVAMPGKHFFNVGADSCQRVDLPNGDILLPVYYLIEDPQAYPTFRDPGWVPSQNAWVTVMRCSFDGTTLRYLNHGDELRVDFARGVGEPSLTHYRGRYFMTTRTDMNGFVTTSDDGQHFGKLKPWVWDDGSDLGNYNTQQHWVTHSDGLFLVYTRRGAKNDHVFRHRAPLFIAQVDAERLCVIRKSERILVPERGARLGNFGVVTVNKDETWVTVTEFMQPPGCERHGSDNSVFAARLKWNLPNRLAM